MQGAFVPKWFSGEIRVRYTERYMQCAAYSGNGSEDGGAGRLTFISIEERPKIKVVQLPHDLQSTRHLFQAFHQHGVESDAEKGDTNFTM